MPYPLNEKSALVFKGKLCTLVIAANRIHSGRMPASDRKLYDTDRNLFLEHAVTCKTEYPYYYDEREVSDLMDMARIDNTWLIDFTGEISPVIPNTDILTPDKYLPLFRTFLCCMTSENQDYDMDTLQERYRKRLKGFIPNDFDLSPYIADISGTYAH